MKLNQKLSFFGFSFLLTGCLSVGPDYTGAPDVDIPEAWNHHFTSTSDETSVDLSKWWHTFNDPLLTQLIEKARLNNLDVQGALFRISEIEALYGIAASDFYPTLNLTGAAVRESTSENLKGVKVQDNYQNIATTASWELDFFGRVRRQVEAASSEVDASVEHYKYVLVRLYAEVAQHYVDVRTLHKRYAVALDNVNAQRQTLDLVRARYDSELVSEMDVLRARQNLASSESTLPLLKGALNQSLNRLAVLLGMLPGTLLKDLNTFKPLPEIPDAMVSRVPRDVLRQRPDVRLAERRLAAQTARIGIAKGNLYPRFSLIGTFGFATPADQALLSQASQKWSFGPQLSWNIFDAGRIRSAVNVENARAEQARISYEKTVLSALEEVENTLVYYAEENERLLHLKKSVDHAHRVVDIAKTQYKNGLTNFQTVLDAERTLLGEEDRLAISQGARLKYLIALYRSMGGGWSEEQTVPLKETQQ